MKKHLFTLALFLGFATLQAQQPALTVTNNTGTSTISCFIPGISMSANVNTTVSPITYTWVSSNANYSGQTVTITSAGIYIVTGFNTSSSFSVSQTFTITKSGNMFLPSVNINPLNPVITCATSSVVLNGYCATTIPPGSGYPSTLPVLCTIWNGPNSLAASCSYTAATAGAYSLTVTDQNNGCSNTAVRIISDHRAFPNVIFPSPSFNIKCPNPTAVIFPLISGSPSAYTYSWTAPVGAVISSATTPSITVDSPGEYQVFITDPTNSCSVNYNISVVICVGIKENKLSQVVLSPNPTHGIFSISLKEEGSTVARVFNSNGSLIKQQTISNKDSTINISELPEGIYFVRLVKQDQASGYIKLIKLSSE